MAVPSPLPSRGRAAAIILLTLAPMLVDAAAVSLTERLTSAPQNRPERFLDDIFGRSESVKATATAATAYLRIASLSIALYEYVFLGIHALSRRSTNVTSSPQLPHHHPCGIQAVCWSARHHEDEVGYFLADSQPPKHILIMVPSL